MEMNLDGFVGSYDDGADSARSRVCSTQAAGVVRTLPLRVVTDALLRSVLKKNIKKEHLRSVGKGTASCWAQEWRSWKKGHYLVLSCSSGESGAS
jgi:hypothetical protein